MCRPVVDNAETETVWSIGINNTTMDEESLPLHSADNTTIEEEEEESPPLFSHSNRTETINSTTQFFSLTEVQPQNTERYTGVSITLTDEETRGGIKRHHDGNLSLNTSCIDQSRVTIVASEDHEVYTDNIPLGGSADCLARVEPYQDPIASVCLPSASCTITTFQNYPGPHYFDVTFTKLSENSKNRHWDFSCLLDKLYIDMNKLVQVEFHVGRSPPAGLSIRALPVFSDANYINEPVKRCPNHATETDPTNENFIYKHHLIRVIGEDVSYLEDPNNHRLSVAFPVLAPAAGSDQISKQIKVKTLERNCFGF